MTAHPADQGTSEPVRSAALLVEVPVELFTAFGRPEAVAASMNRGLDRSAADVARQPHVEVNP